METFPTRNKLKEHLILGNRRSGKTTRLFDYVIEHMENREGEGSEIAFFTLGVGQKKYTARKFQDYLSPYRKVCYEARTDTIFVPDYDSKIVFYDVVNSPLRGAKYSLYVGELHGNFFDSMQHINNVRIFADLQGGGEMIWAVDVQDSPVSFEMLSGQHIPDEEVEHYEKMMRPEQWRKW